MVDVYVLPQTHYYKHRTPRSGMSGRRLFEYTARSQHRIAQVLLKNPKAAIFAEGVFGNFTPQVYRLMLKDRFVLMMKARGAFPGDIIPLSYTKLAISQKRFLVSHGAARTLFLLGRVKTLRKTENRARKKEADLAYRRMRLHIGDLARCLVLTPGTRIHSTVMREREKRAIRNIEQFISSARYGGGNIFLIFGSVHNFLKYNSSSRRLRFVIHHQFKSLFLRSQNNVKNVRRKCIDAADVILRIVLYPLIILRRMYRFFFDQSR